MIPTDLEARARELLAAEYDKSGVPDFARRVRSTEEFGAIHGGIALRAIIAALSTTDRWLPIEEADREWCLVYTENGHALGFKKSDDSWHVEGGGTPTKFQPLPLPPKDESE